MWFRNLKLYRFDATPLSIETLDTALQTRPLGTCGSMEHCTRGWVAPRQEGVFVHAVNRQWLIALGVEEKLLPAAVMRQYAAARAAEIEREQGRKVGRREMREIADRVVEVHLPTALRRQRQTWAWIDPVNGWLVIDTASDARADEFIEKLLATVDDLSPRPLQTQVSPNTAMTDWLAGGEAPAVFSVDSDTELRSCSAAQATIRYAHHSLDGPEIAEHVAHGKIATRLGLTWNDRVSFVLTDKLHIKRLTFLDVVREQAAQSAMNADEQFDVDFALMAGELAGMLKDLVAALGGVKEATA